MDGHILNFRQRLGAAPDPCIWNHLPYQFRTPLLEILRMSLSVYSYRAMVKCVSCRAETNIRLVRIFARLHKYSNT